MNRIWLLTRATGWMLAAAGLAGCSGSLLGRGNRPTAPPPPAASAARSALSADQILTVDQLKPGMTGYGLTVFSGARPERFNIEVISVLKNYDPQTDMILIRCSGHDLEKTGIAAGMSGSPIYVNGKLIGALAYGWRFAREPIAGVQPIEQMLRNSGMRVDLPPATQEELPAAGHGWRSGASATVTVSFDLSRPGPAVAAGRGPGSSGPADTTRLAPLATPLMVSGGSPLAMELLGQRLEGTGLVPLKSGGAGNDPRLADARLEPGGTVAIPLVTGDLDLAAIGTVTAVAGDRVLAFGHPIYGEGPVNSPMATGVIHTFIPSLMSSFKMGSAGPVVGAIRRDESTSVVGVMGQAPFMSPMTVRVAPWEGSAGKTYSYRIADDWYFSAMAAAFAAVNSATADHGQPVELTVYYRGQVRFRGFDPYRFEGMGVGPWGLRGMAGRIGGPIDSMLNNPWGKALVESIELEVRLVNEDRTARLERVRLEASVLAPGEPAVLHLALLPYRKPRVEKTIRVDLPADLPDGTYSLAVLDGDDYRDLMRSHNPRLFAPENMHELLAGYNRLAEPRDDELYVVLTLPTGGLTTEDQVLPALPPSRALILQQANRFKLRPYTEDKVWVHPMNLMVVGSERFQITIDKNKNRKK